MDQDHRLAEELNRHSAHYRDKLFNVLVATLLRWNKISFSGKFRDFVIVCNQPTLRLDAAGIRTRTSISIAIPNKLTLLVCESFEGPQYSFPCLGLWKMCSTRWEVNCIESVWINWWRQSSAVDSSLFDSSTTRFSGGAWWSCAIKFEIDKQNKN